MAPEVKIKITAAAELSALRSLNDSLGKQIIQAKALGKDYQDLEKDLLKVQKAMADIKPPSFLEKGKNALSEIVKELPVIGAISRNFNGQTPWIGAAVGSAVVGVEAVKIFGEGIVKAAEYADQMEELGTRTGQSAADAIVMTQAFRNVGLEAANVGAAVNMLQMALTGVNEEGLPTKAVFDKLGLSLDELKDMSPINALQAISEKLAGLGSAAEKTRAVKDLFGQSGPTLMPILGDTKAFDTAKTQVGELAETIGANTEELGKFADAWASLDVKKMQLFAGFAAQFAGSLGNAADNLNKLDLSKVGRATGEFVKDGGTLAADFYSKSEILKSVVGGFKAVGAYAQLKAVEIDTAATDKKTSELEATLLERMLVPSKQAEHLRQLEANRSEEQAKTDLKKEVEKEKKIEEQKKREASVAKDLADLQDADRLKALPLADQKAELDKRAAALDAGLKNPDQSKEQFTDSQKLRLDVEKQRLDVNRQIAEEQKKQADQDRDNATRRDALDLELAIREAQASGNDVLAERLQWQKQYNDLLKARVDAGDPDAWNKAVRGANASLGDPLARARAIEKETGAAVQLSSLGRLGMAMGESTNAAETVNKLQELIIAQKESSQSLDSIQKNTREIADKRGGYQ